VERGDEKRKILIVKRNKKIPARKEKFFSCCRLTRKAELDWGEQLRVISEGNLSKKAY
jgi:hypothetical protein